MQQAAGDFARLQCLHVHFFKAVSLVLLPRPPHLYLHTKSKHLSTLETGLPVYRAGHNRVKHRTPYGSRKRGGERERIRDGEGEAGRRESERAPGVEILYYTYTDFGSASLDRRERRRNRPAGRKASCWLKRQTFFRKDQVFSTWRRAGLHQHYLFRSPDLALWSFSLNFFPLPPF